MATKASDSIDFNTAYALYEKISRSNNYAEIASALRVCFSVATTTHEVFKTWYADNDPKMKDLFTWKEVRLRMLMLATTPEDAWLVYRNLRCRRKHSKKNSVAFKKVLALCKSKEQVQNVEDNIRNVCDNYSFRHRWDNLPERLVNFLHMLKKREGELPSCPEDRTPPGIVYERGFNRTYQRWGTWPDV